MRDQPSLILNSLKHIESDEKKHLILREFKKQQLRTSIFHLCRYLGYNDIDRTVHAEIIQCLEDSNPRKIICVPRGTMKSTIASIVYPIWLLIRNPDLRILIDSEIYSNSITYLRAIRMHLESEAMVSLFGNFRTDSVWREDSMLIAQRKKNLKEPSITAGGVGTTRVGQHYDLIIGDDYNSPANTSTKDQSQKVIDHFRYNLNILDPGGSYVIIGTRYGESDLIGWVLQNLLNEPKLAEGNIEAY
jgi:hypothetical protein